MASCWISHVPPIFILYLMSRFTLVLSLLSSLSVLTCHLSWFHLSRVHSFAAAVIIVYEVHDFFNTGGLEVLLNALESTECCAHVRDLEHMVDYVPDALEEELLHDLVLLYSNS